MAEAAVDALSHVNVVAGGSAAAVGSWLSLDCDGLGSGTGSQHLPATPGTPHRSSPPACLHGLAPPGGLTPGAYRADPGSSTFSPDMSFLTSLPKGCLPRLLCRPLHTCSSCFFLVYLCAKHWYLLPENRSPRKGELMPACVTAAPVAVRCSVTVGLC